MALEMVHLLVADAFAKQYRQYLNCPEFYLGAISPDAIHIRDKDDKSHKDEIHLFNWRCVNTFRVMDYWKYHTTPFDIGYGVHVLTDGQWVPRFRHRIPEIIYPDGKLNTAVYYNDTFVTDYRLRDETPRLAALLDMIESAKAPGDHPLLTEYELTSWRDDILASYRGQCPKHDPVRYIDTEYVRTFVSDCMDIIDDTFRRGVYHE